MKKVVGNRGSRNYRYPGFYSEFRCDMEADPEEGNPRMPEPKHPANRTDGK